MNKISIVIRPSIILGAIIAAVLIYFAQRSNHPMAPDFISRLVFEGGYKFMALFTFYLASRFITGIRRHELVEKSGGSGSHGAIAIYCVTVLCVGLIIAFVK